MAASFANFGKEVLSVCKNHILLYRIIYHCIMIKKWQYIDTSKLCIVTPLVCPYVHVRVYSTCSIVTCYALVNVYRFVPDLDDIVTFEDMVAEDTFSEETKVSAK